MDRNDARGLAHLMRRGWFRPVHCKSMAVQQVRALLTTRKLVQSKLHDMEMSLRGILGCFGLKVGPATSRSLAAGIIHLVAGRPSLEMVAEALLFAHVAALCAFKDLAKKVRQISRADEWVRLLMSAPGGGPQVALTCVSGRRMVVGELVAASVDAHVVNEQGFLRWRADWHCALLRAPYGGGQIASLGHACSVIAPRRPQRSL